MLSLPSPRDNQCLYLDMNSFFASCEQHRRPELRGKPVAVTPTMAHSGCITAASYEAKRYGIKTGWRVGEAKARLPELTILDTDHRYYVEIHQQIRAFLEQEISPDVTVMSIDEFAIKLDKHEQWTPNAHALAKFIHKRLTERFSPALRGSIGVGPNVFLAKLGTEIQKPNGLVIIQTHTIAQAMNQLKRLRDIPGINHGMEDSLHAIGISNPSAFYQAPRTLLSDRFGTLGNLWWHQLHGYHVTSHTAFKSSHTPKSVSHSHVFGPSLRTKDRARTVAYKLCIKVAERLRSHGLATKQVSISVRCKHSRFETALTLSPTQSAFALFQPLATWYDAALPASAEPFQIIVVAHNLQPYVSTQLPCFTRRNDDAALAAVDTLNRRHGRWTVKPASLLIAGDAAPNRITFQPPQYDMD